MANKFMNKEKFMKLKQAPASMSPAHLHQYASSGQLSESLPSSQVIECDLLMPFAYSN